MLREAESFCGVQNFEADSLFVSKNFVSHDKLSLRNSTKRKKRKEKQNV